MLYRRLPGFRLTDDESRLSKRTERDNTVNYTPYHSGDASISTFIKSRFFNFSINSIPLI
jgi:hypothetical protein